MVMATPPLAEPVIDPGGVTIKPPFEMGVANFDLPGLGFNRFSSYRPECVGSRQDKRRYNFACDSA